jgi:hypothetical protein
VREIKTPGAPTDRIRTVEVILLLWDQEEKYLRKKEKENVLVVNSIPVYGMGFYNCEKTAWLHAGKHSFRWAQFIPT